LWDFVPINEKYQQPDIKEFEMQKSKQKITEQEAQARRHQNITCQICSRKIESDACNWQADDGGGIYCEDCWTEKGSCGCSD
jgi:hypothetical protein